jgi:hypothetical protein
MFKIVASVETSNGSSSTTNNRGGAACDIVE